MNTGKLFRKMDADKKGAAVVRYASAGWNRGDLAAGLGGLRRRRARHRCKGRSPTPESVDQTRRA